MITDTVCRNCGHKYKTDGIKKGEVIEVKCPNCKVKKRVCIMKVGNIHSYDESEIKWIPGEIFSNLKEKR